MTMHVTAIPTRVNKTLANWLLDSSIHTANKILVSTDEFYANGHQKFKFANGSQPWSTLPYAPEGTPDTNFAEDDLVLDDNRTHDAFGYSMSITDLRQLRFESTSAPMGSPNFEFDASAATSGSDVVMRVRTALGTSIQVNGDKRVGINDSPIFYAMLRVNATSDHAIDAYASGSGGRAFNGQSDGVNGFGFLASANNTGGTGMQATGMAYGCRAQVVDATGVGLNVIGNAYVETFGINSSKHASAALEVNSITKGLLLPRMTDAQMNAIPSPAFGLMVYVTDAVEGVYVYKPSGWTFIG